jgi:hypothetical protein
MLILTTEETYFFYFIYYKIYLKYADSSFFQNQRFRDSRQTMLHCHRWLVDARKRRRTQKLHRLLSTEWSRRQSEKHFMIV